MPDTLTLTRQTDTPLMRHWRAVDAILTAAGERPATYGEIRYVEHEPPMQAAFDIWKDRH